MTAAAELGTMGIVDVVVVILPKLAKAETDIGNAIVITVRTRMIPSTEGSVILLLLTLVLK